jgi:hypothetical protein
MANKKISELTGLTTPASGDLFPVTDISDTITSGSPSGTTKKVTLTNLMAQAPVQSVAGKSGVVTLENADVTGSASSVDLATEVTSLTGLINARATGAQGALADSATQPGDNISTLTNDSNFITSAGSPVQSVAGKTGAVSLVNTDVSGLGTASTKDVGTSANNVIQLDGTSKLPAVDGSNLTGISSAVEGSAVLSTGETGGTKYLREDGDNSSSWQPLAIGAEQLRGTTNPHIGAFPNQSFLVVDNPTKSVMLASDADGTLNVINSAGKFAIPVGLSVTEDSSEPDIEITTTSGTYSLITGDSDALGANGLPLRQGFNNPDIGANQAPLLISGGSIV